MLKKGMIVLKMDYNSWFYNQHKYLTGSRDGNKSFVDTKWINFNKRYRKLVDMGSDLMNEQPYVVIGNNNGFDKLLDLMSRSNYAFQDINDSLIKTYRMSLQNSMSRNLVNTHAVMFHCTNTDKNATPDKFTHYWIIDAPFNQMHFGERDEFIRQKIHDMHITENDLYMDISRFNNTEISKIMDFSIMCTVNGYISNDCKVAIDDKGFKFKIGWPYSSDVEFIIYKLDHSYVLRREITSKQLTNTNGVISYDVLKNVDKTKVNGMKCIVDIYDKRFVKTTPTAPNFGIFTDNGLEIRNLQKITTNMIDRQNTFDLSVDIIGLRYFHEVPNVFPACNYYDIMETRRVFTRDYENIKNTNNDTIVVSNTNNVNHLEKCTPPIVLDRDVHYSFNVISSCITMFDEMLKYESDIISVGSNISMDGYSYESFVNNDKPVLNNIYNGLFQLYKTYQQGAMLTSLVGSDEMDTFTTLINNIYMLKNVDNVNDIQKYTFDELYGLNYRATITTITSPFRSDLLSNFTNIGDISGNYFTSDNSTRFNRPVAEQSFISLRYNHDDNCWVFAYPEIKHFNGIGNTFYIDENLKGNEIFKFFVLYTDTESVETNINHFEEDVVFDFDKFCNEVDKHIGCIRYWDAECRLLKISKMLYNDYNDETCVQIFSKILKRKLSCDDLLSIYPSDINYEDSNVTSDNWENYDENTERSPFAINYLFYTLSMLNDNEDKLQSYFYRQLTNNKYDDRYVDLSITDLIYDSKRYPVDLNRYTIAPSVLPDDCVKPESNVIVYYGLPLILDNNESNLYTAYRYVANVYNNITYPLITTNDVDNDYHVRYDDITQYGGMQVSYYSDILLGKLCTKYLSSLYDYITKLETNYCSCFNQASLIESGIDTINKHIDQISSLSKSASFNVDKSNDVCDIIINNNMVIELFNNIKNKINEIISYNFTGRNTNIIGFINELLSVLRKVYVTCGFDNCMLKRARMLYIDLKKINTTMNAYEFKQWLNHIDTYCLWVLDKYIATNENYTYASNMFMQYYLKLDSYIGYVNDKIDELHDMLNNVSSTLHDGHIQPIIDYCNDIINNYIFDLFIINDINYDDNIEYNTCPEYVVIDIPESEHTKPKVGTELIGDHSLIFQPITEMVNGKYYIRNIVKICEYIMFNGETLSNLNAKILGKDGNVLSNTTISLSFIRISSTADRNAIFTQLINSNNIPIEFENTHESFDVVNGLIVNKKHADMNYEMLIGNHFYPLEHEIELILKPDTWLQGSVDKLYLSNQMINKLIMNDFSHKRCMNMYFKPVQVIHITPNDDGSIDSVNGKYFEGQTVYISTNEGFTFPIIITAVDHSINKGFIEAVVDYQNTRWFEVSDKTMITKYLNENIECHVVDDNIRNFLDEFNNSSYYSYSNPSNVVLDEMNDVYTLPGDPLFVSNNAEFVYTRLNWFFNELVPNRFIDESHKMYHFIYITSGFINDENDNLRINMVNYNHDHLTNPEKHPVLRDEPNDHDIWQNELSTFKSYKNDSYRSQMSFDRFRSQAISALERATTDEEKERLTLIINDYDLKIQREIDFQKRMDLYMKQLETPTTWFNVRSYDATLVYIANGRADKFSPSFIDNIRDLPYDDKLEVYLYDWENKQWLNPNSYSININMIDNIKIDEHDDYSTNRVLHSITITPNNDFNYSSKILVYFAYSQSSIFDDIKMNDSSCFVRFKPLLSLDDGINNYDPYANIRIRKHFNGYEKYSIEMDEDNTNKIHINRINRNGKYVNSPMFRVCDITYVDDNGNHTFEDIDKFYVRSPFKDVQTNSVVHYKTYTTAINSDIDGFVENVKVKLICISNNENSSYDGNISDVMFIGITSIVDGKQNIDIIDSTLPNYANGNFVCSVFKDNAYKPCGGVITINVDNDVESTMDDEWISIPNDYIRYREIPDEFMFTTKNPINGNKVIVILENKYIKDIDDVVNMNNDNDNPFEYYYDTKKNVRLPVSDVRINSHDTRLTIDTNVNQDVKLIKSPYIGICRYSTKTIPEDGLIDLTGYIPTPLSRNRYEFWINGRCLNHTDSLTILSPTSIQLHDLKSLRNFEVIELVDDINDNALMSKSNVYIDINGNTFSSYKLALLSNSRISSQNVMFTFNANNHKHIHDYSKNIIYKPNNLDVEEDILSGITFSDNITDYTKLYNIPSINGVTLFNVTTKDLGITEIPNDKIIDMFDKIWKRESMTNPLFIMTHRVDNNESCSIHVKQINENHWNDLPYDTRGMFVVYTNGFDDKYFTLYISKQSNGKIDDINNTVKIISFISNGVYVLIDKSYSGMWLHSTQPNTKPIHIINLNK